MFFARRGGIAHVLDLVFVESGDTVDNDPRQRTTKVDNLVHQERHDSSCENVVLHKGIPSSPQALEGVEMDIVGGYFIVLAPERVG